MEILLQLVQVAAGAGEAIEAASALFGPVGIILGTLILAIIIGMSIAIKKLWDRNKKLEKRNQALQDRHAELQDQMTSTLRDVLEMMQRLESNLTSFSNKYDRTTRRIENTVELNRDEILDRVERVIDAVRNQTNTLQSDSES